MEITSIEAFLPYNENIRARTERVIACIPPPQLEWRPQTDAFSFGDLIRHLGAIERYMFAENAQGRPSRYPGHGPELAAGWDGVLAFFRRMHSESVAILGGLRLEDLRRRCTTPGGAALPVWKWLRAMVEHEVHHRGQLYLDAEDARRVNAAALWAHLRRGQGAERSLPTSMSQVFSPA